MLLRVLFQLTVVVALMILVATAIVVGRDRLVRTRREYRSRLKAAAPITGVLAAVLLFNGVAREIVPDLSWITEFLTWTVGWNATGTIYRLEGEFIVWFQDLATPWATAYFSFIYVYGYVFLLVFPVIAYFALADTRPLRELLASYTLNYVLGLVCYVIVIAYGPRNVMPELVDALLYDTYPQYQHLTRQVNRNTNVFPSLHTSLAVTVAFVAYRTRDVYRLWFPIAAVLGLSVAISTMYLGIHWAIDVVAGVGLAAVSVALAARLVGRWSITDVLEEWSPAGGD